MQPFPPLHWAYFFGKTAQNVITWIFSNRQTNKHHLKRQPETWLSFPQELMDEYMIEMKKSVHSNSTSLEDQPPGLQPFLHTILLGCSTWRLPSSSWR